MIYGAVLILYISVICVLFLLFFTFHPVEKHGAFSFYLFTLYYAMLIAGKIRSANIKLLFVIMYLVIITLFDAYSYGIVYQQKIKHENYKSTFWQWVFHESVSSEDGIVSVTRYRMIQKAIEISGIIIILYYCGLWAALGLLISHYLLTYDLLFYIVMGQTYLFADFEKHVNTYWLQNWYQIGYFIFKPFNSLYFYVSGLSGLAITMFSCFIGRKRPH